MYVKNVGSILKIYRFVQKYENRSFRQSWDYDMKTLGSIDIHVSISDFHNKSIKWIVIIIIFQLHCFQN